MTNVAASGEHSVPDVAAAYKEVNETWQRPKQ